MSTILLYYIWTSKSYFVFFSLLYAFVNVTLSSNSRKQMVQSKIRDSDHDHTEQSNSSKQSASTTIVLWMAYHRKAMNIVCRIMQIRNSEAVQHAILYW